MNASPEETFWYWIRERHEMYRKREVERLPKPWTADPILQAYRFCNPFRENDKVTTWLRENFLLPNADSSADILAFNIVWFRFFNRIETAAALGFMNEWDPVAIKATLRDRQKRKLPVFTGAYIVRSENGQPKIDSVVNALEPIWEARLEIADACRETQSLEAMTKWMTRFRLIGTFMAFEMVSDMRHTKLLNTATDIMTWANPGPGAMRGLRRMFGTPKMRKDGQIEQWLPGKSYVALMQELLARAPEQLGPDFPKMEMREIEHSLCEFDKYSRVKNNEGRPRSLYAGGAAA